MRLFRPDWRDRRGQAMVEFALVVPLFILVIFGILDFGRGVYAYNTISNASREGVRVGIVNQSQPAIRTRATDFAVGVGTTSADVTIRFLQPDYTNAAPCSTNPRLGCIVEVEVRHRFTPVTPILGQLIGSIDMAGSSRQPIERTFSGP